MPINGYLGGVISATAPTVNNSGASGVFTLDEQLQYAGQNLWPGYQISRSVRLRSSASAYFNRTPASAGNRKTWTWSGWVKRGVLGSVQSLFSAYSANTDAGYLALNFNASDQISLIGGSTTWRTSNAVYRDPSAWYHVVLSFDTTQATATNRARIYVNGVILTWATDNALTLNTDYVINNNVANYLAISDSGSGSIKLFDGYLTEINFIDGQALTPTSFGAFDAVTGIWNPIRYSGTYGTNGFYLNFSDNSSNTATTIGKDSSGNGNNWTPNNISVTAGTTYDSMVDTPTSYGSDTGAGGTVRGNYAVLNPLDLSYGARGNLTAANLTYTGNASTNNWATATMQVTSGQFYFEATLTSQSASNLNVIGLSNNAASYGSTNGQVYKNGSLFGTYATYTTGDVIGVAFNASTGDCSFYKNNTLIVTLTGVTASPLVPYVYSASNSVIDFNFGQRAFSYTAPSGFKALCTQNLPTPTILNGANYMAASLYTGNGGTNAITNTVNGVSFQPDLVWGKSRTNIRNNNLYDSVRGVGNMLISNATTAELTGGELTAFASNGFTLGTNVYQMNASGDSLVAWQWKANGAGSFNTAGSISSTVSVNATSGFSIGSYTGTGANATVGHGLGVAPNWIIIKNRSSTQAWTVGTASPGGWDRYITLNSTDAVTLDSTVWNTTNPTSSVFSVGTSLRVNGNGGTYVAYCFAAISGYSAFGSYTGNGSSDGPFVYTGFRPRFVLFKRTDTSGNYWTIRDTSRNPNNESQLSLYPNVSDAETTSSSGGIDILSNGFKLRGSASDGNTNGGTYIYAAFAENPFTLSRAR